MGGVGSGGHNRLSIEEHKLRGTYRYQDRDRDGTPEGRSVEWVSPAMRRRALRGLPPEARRAAADILDSFGNWDLGSVATLRSYVLCLGRVAALEAAGAGKELHAEARLALALRRGLGLEGS